jgi:hypothetical protein
MERPEGGTMAAMVRAANGGLQTLVCTMMFHELCVKKEQLIR